MQPDQETKPIFGQSDLGCYFDSSRGRYIGVAVIKMAGSHGWDSPKGDSERVNPLDSEWYGEMTDEAIEYLQSLTLDGLWWGYTESGDFGLWLVDCDFCDGVGSQSQQGVPCIECKGTGNELQIKL